MHFRSHGNGIALSATGGKSHRTAIRRFACAGKFHGTGFAFLAPGNESLGNGIRTLVVAIRLLADGHGLLVNAHRFLNIACRPLNIGHGFLNIGHESDNIVINLLNIGQKPSENGHFHHVTEPKQTEPTTHRNHAEKPITMPDSSSSSSPSATQRTKGYFNKAQLEDIAIAEDIFPPASDSARAAAFAARAITADYIAGLAAAVAQARAKISATGQDADESHAATLNADDAERTLITILQSVQSAAKQKHRMLAEDDDDTTDFATDGYLIGQRLNANRALLLQNAANLKGKAEADALPGFGTPASIQAITDAIATYKSATADQAERDREAGEDRIARDKLIRKINARRIAIQHAADSIWPYTDEDNGPIRGLFHLPKSRPLME